jgi:hypothetical protein
MVPPDPITARLPITRGSADADKRACALDRPVGRHLGAARGDRLELGRRQVVAPRAARIALVASTLSLGVVEAMGQEVVDGVLRELASWKMRRPRSGLVVPLLWHRTTFAESVLGRATERVWRSPR